MTAYKWKTDLNKHIKSHFVKNQKIPCERCKTWVLPKNMGEHVASKHTGEFLYKCPCGQGFFSNSRYSVHKGHCSDYVEAKEKEKETGKEKKKKREKKKKKKREKKKISKNK